MQQLCGSLQAPPVSRVVDQIGFSQRRFIQLFGDRGWTYAEAVLPGAAAFRRSSKLLMLWTQINWTQMALECGYYDQAHFIHDFQSFAGITPSEYLARKTPHVNHVPMEYRSNFYKTFAD